MLEMPLVSRVVSVPKALPIVVAVKVTSAASPVECH